MGVRAGMSAASLTQSLFSLPVPERIAQADPLHASAPQDWQAEADAAWLEEAERRSAEMETHPDMVLNHDEFLAGIILKGGKA